jgi:trehalose synthase
MAGVLDIFVEMGADAPHDAHSMRVGPDVAGVTDDPEGARLHSPAQRHASPIVPKSLVEEFGLTVTEAGVEGQAGHRQPRRRHPGPDRRWTRRPTT